MLYFITDIDECAGETFPCSENMNCTNTLGSYVCECIHALNEDGETCKGLCINIQL